MRVKTIYLVTFNIKGRPVMEQFDQPQFWQVAFSSKDKIVGITKHQVCY